MIPTIEWQGQQVRMIDQRKLPGKKEWVVCRSHKDVVRAIRTMAIRGAPAIGVAGAMGLALGARSIRTANYVRFMLRLKTIGDEMVGARPTAVNLRWAVQRMLKVAGRMRSHAVAEIQDALQRESEAILTEDIAVNRQMGMNGRS